MGSGSWSDHPIAGLFLLLGGLVLIGGSVWAAQERIRFAKSTERAPGIVVALERERGVRGSVRDHPVVRYLQPDGTEHEFKSRFGIWPSVFAQGDEVMVAYDPRNERDPEIDSFWTLWFLPCVMLTFGLACALAGASNVRHAWPGIARHG